MLRDCLYVHARVLRPLIRIFRRWFYQPDLEAVERLGEADSWISFQAHVDGFAYDTQMRCSWAKNHLRLRLSGRKAREVAETLFGPETYSWRPSEPSLSPSPAIARHAA